ncbi:MAG TPA: AAA family ATPase [Syntrophorhabdaceae bacterium]|nr:AAA family ATPase [Syntrophorhabdaceae bacterium]
MEIPYLEYFGLTEKPFGMSPDPAFYFESEEHKKAFDYLTFFTSQQEGFALIYGDVGSGKTTISRIFLNSLDREAYNTALILNPVTDETEFMKELLKEFSIQYEPHTKKELYDTLRHFLLEEFQKGKENILIIDEAQLLSYEMLEFIRLLSNIETDKRKILHTVFFAQPEFLDRLKDPGLRHLAQRITVTYGIRPLTYHEVKSYINYRLFKAGSRGPLEFQDRAVRLIHMASKGYPRLINYICDRCLLVLYAASAHTVDTSVVSKVLIEESIPLASVKKTWREKSMRIYPLAGGAALLVILGMAGYHFFLPDSHRHFLTGAKTPSQMSAAPKSEAQDNSYAQNNGQTGAYATGMASGGASSGSGNIEIPLRKVVVNTEAANVRLSPDTNSQRIGTIMKGAILPVFAEQIDKNNLKWYRIVLYEGTEGWIASTVVEAD